MKKNRFKLSVILLPLILFPFIFGSQAKAQNVVSLPIGISVGLPDSQEAIPGQFVTYTFILSNSGINPIKLVLDAGTGHGWTLIGPDKEVTIDPHSDLPLPVTLVVPADALGGTSEQLALRIAYAGQTWDFQVETKIAVIRKIVANGPVHGKTEPEKEADYPILVINQGSLPETISLSSVSEQGWRTRVEPQKIALQPGGKTVIHLFHAPPHTAVIGSVDKLTLTLTPNDGAAVNYAVYTQVIESAAPEPIEQKIPLRTTWLWEYASPTELIPTPELRWTYSMSGSLLPQYNFELYLNGFYDTEQLLLPDSISFNLTTPNSVYRFGRLDPLWTGILPLPTQNALFSWDNSNLNGMRLQFLVGTERDDENFFSDQPRWLSLSASRPNSPWIFRLLLPSSDYRNDPDYLGEIDYAVNFGNEKNTWSLWTRVGGGRGPVGFRRADAVSLTGYGEKWNFIGEFSQKDGFFAENDEEILTFLGRYQFCPDLVYEIGYSLWNSAESADARSYRSLWTGFNLWQHFSLKLSTNKEETASDQYRQPKIELRYYNQNPPHNVYFTIQWMQSDYVLNQDNDNTRWSLDGQYKYSWSGVHYLESDIHSTVWFGTSNPNRTFTYRLKYSYPVRNNLTFLTSAGWDYVSEPQKDKTFTLYGELGYRPTSEIQWKLSLSNVYSTLYGANLSVNLFYQGQFLSFLPSPWSGIDGIIFEDLNGNGRKDPEDPPVEKIIVILDGKKTALSGSDGRWAFNLLAPGPHLLTLNLDKSPYYSDMASWDLNLRHGLTDRVCIPLKRKLFIRGLLFVDDNLNGQPDQDEKPLAGVVLTLLQGDTATASTLSAADGCFYFNDLLPGTYRIRIDPATLPADVIPPVDEQEVVLFAGMPSDVNWGLKHKEKEIEITYDATGVS